MLVLTRKPTQRIMIGGLSGMPLVEITVVRVRGDDVRLGIEAPPEVTVYRQEVFEAIAQDRQVPPAELGGDEPPRDDDTTAPSPAENGDARRRREAADDEEMEDF